MQELLLKRVLEQVTADIESLPLSAVQLVGGLIAMQEGIPPWLRDFVMAKLDNRVDMRVVSPAAEAVMRIHAFSQYSDMEFANAEIRVQHEILKAIALNDKVFVAVAFMNRFADRLAILADSTHGDGEHMATSAKQAPPGYRATGASSK